MKSRHFISLIFMVAIAGLSVIPVRHHFFAGPVEPLPSHHTYRAVFSGILPAAIAREAEKHGCRGYLLPVVQVEGDGLPLASLVDDVNLALASYSGWKLRVDESLKKKMVRRADERFKAWGSMGVGREMVAFLEARKSVSMGTRYSAQARYYRIPQGGDDTRLVVTVSDETLQSRLFEIPVTFIHPATLSELVKIREEKLSHAADLAERSRLCLWGLAGVSALFLFYLLVSAAAGAVRFGRGRRYRAYLAQEIGKREELVRNGHFVTACELADRYLKAFPDDTHIKAFMRRLLDFTNNDPEKAQLAYVEWKKLKVRMKDFPARRDLFLSPDEQDRIRALLPYYPQLRTTYAEFAAMAAAEKREEERDASRQLETVLGDLRAGHIRDAQEKLKKLLAAHAGFEQAEALDRQLRSAPEGHFIIRKSGNGSQVEVLCSPVVTVGRKDVGIHPDIAVNDRRVSRKHLSIAIEDGTVVAEDAGSLGGTFVNGDKITRRELHDGDHLTLAKAIDYEVRLFKEENGRTGGVFLKGKDRNILVVESGIGFDFVTDGVRCPGHMISVIKRDGVTVLSTPQETILPEKGRRFRADTQQFVVEGGPSGGPAGG